MTDLMNSRERFQARLRELGYGSYQRYLQSDHWAEVRLRFFQSRLFHDKCAACGGPGPFDVHHLTYKRLGREWLHDLAALCRPCHHSVHKLESSSGKNLWSTTRTYLRRSRREQGRPLPTQGKRSLTSSSSVARRP